MWGVITPDEAKAKIEEQIREAGIKEPRNLEEQAISLVGRDIYEKLVKGYTEKQWGRRATELPAFIIRRLPVRMTYDNNYFNDKYQGIPVGGYTKMVEAMLDGVEVRLNTDFLKTVRSLNRWRRRLFLPETLTGTLISARVNWSTGACVLKRRFWTRKTIREMRW